MSELTKESKGKRCSQGLGKRCKGKRRFDTLPLQFKSGNPLINKDHDDFSLPKVDLVLLFLNETCFLVVLCNLKLP